MQCICKGSTIILFGLSQQDNFSNNGRKANKVEVVICLVEGGSQIPGCCYLHVEAAISWMRKHLSKTRRVFSKLTDPKQEKHYKRRYD
jgi:hypothetical protein